MKIGSSIVLIALGAILSFAVQDTVDFVDMVTVGYILMVAGFLGLIVSLMLGAKSRNRITESRTAVDPNTGEKFTQSKSVDDGVNRGELL